MLIQMIIQRTDINIYVRMCFLHFLHSFRSCDDNHKVDIFYTFVFQHLDCCCGRSTCCKHWVNNKYFTVCAVIR